MFKGLSPAWRALRVTASCGAQVVKPKGSRSIRELQVKGKTERTNENEPLMMPRHVEPRRWDGVVGVEDWLLGSGRRRLRRPSQPGEHRRPGV